PDTFWSFKHALKFIDKKASNPPLGLITIAAMLPENWQKRLVDLNIEPLTEEALTWADFVMVSAMVVQRESTHQVIARCKEAGKTVIAGGPIFTGEYEDFPLVDHFILNEGEITLPLFLNDWERGTLQRIYQTSKFADMSTTPPPMWELLNLKEYATMSLQFSRGCPFDCEFCNVTALLGHQPRTKNAQQLIIELDNLYALGWRDSIFLVDDNFIGNKKIIKQELLPALIQWRKGKNGIPFSTEASINLADDPQLMDLMAKAGFNAVFIGIETPNNNSLVECNKKQNLNRDLVESVKIIQRAGMMVQGGFIVGFDSDTNTIFEQQENFIRKAGITTAMIGLLQAPSGTRLYKRLLGEGRLLGEMTGDNADGSTNIIPHLDVQFLKSGYIKLVKQLYHPKDYYRRCLMLLKTIKTPEIRRGIDVSYVR
ncbi:MAG: B12-binding domain-containing radical SAM protein, partial [Anaerolineaceae bacterium]|nr:B12-binding domain-containing radical SAM protein [Anaerolineaceae bacterium]